MNEKATGQNVTRSLQPYLGRASVWAISVGSSIGWGSLVVTSTNYLNKAGPLGSIIGLLIGALLMILISWSYHYMSNQYPDSGGIYTYTKHVFGYDRAFLVSWFLSLTYISMFWANATSLPLFARYFLNKVFSFGYLYSVFGYEVYIGEALLTLAAIGLITLLCIRSKLAASRAMLVMVLLFTVSIIICFVAAMVGHAGSDLSFEPMFAPQKSAMNQIIGITVISPWAFVGFENVSHSAEEFTFRSGKLFRILLASVITSTVLYVFLFLLSISAYPADSRTWLDYITNLDHYEGIEGLPAFFAARHYMGEAGIDILMVALLALVFTSLIGHLRALSRLFYSISRDDILPRTFSQLNKKDIPQNAMLLVALVSLPIPFLGRTAIGWIVDITTIGATIIYGFVSAAAFKSARRNGSKGTMVISGISFLLMVALGVYLLFPNLFSNDTLETETYILLIIWSIIGFFYFRRIIYKDHARRFGKAIIVWIALLALIVFMALIWSGRRDESITMDTVQQIQSYYEGTADPEALAMPPEEFMEQQQNTLRNSNSMNTLIVIGMFVLALGAMLINHLSMRKWESRIEKERDSARDVAYKDSLTGVKSKHAFVEYEREMAEGIYNGTAGEFAVIVCDVNGLKHVNDTLGHKAGDKYIQDACEMICEYYQHSPVFRVGGDEFAVLLQGRDYENRHEILQAINQHIERNLGTGKVVASLGMAEFDPVEDNTFHAVFTRADANMYERKKQLKSMGAVTRD